MSITGSLIIFVLIWWIIFFSLLPIDVDRKHKEMVEGADKGSPENPKIIKKIIYTTIITSIIFIGNKIQEFESSCLGKTLYYSFVKDLLGNTSVYIRN